MATKSAVLLGLLTVLCVVAQAQAAKSTVCTITVNSADEKQTFRRYLPKTNTSSSSSSSGAGRIGLPRLAGSM